MYTDTVIEFFVKRENDSSRKLKYIGITAFIILATLILLVIGAMFISLVALCLALEVLVIVAGVIMIRAMKVEYEYSFISGDLRVDKILNKTKRKPMFKIEVKDIDKVGIYKKGEISLKDFAEVINITDSDIPEECIYMQINSANVTMTGKKDLPKGRVLILAQNDERVLKAVKQYVKSMVYREGFNGVSAKPADISANS